jgi:hypothetical protein
MSVKPRLPLDLDRSNRPGSEPKIVAGSHLKPLSGVAGINSPHHVPSAGRKFLTGPKVRNTVVAPLTLTLTPVGLTLIVCAVTAGASRNRKMTDRKRKLGATERTENTEKLICPLRPLCALWLFIHMKTAVMSAIFLSRIFPFAIFLSPTLLILFKRKRN